MTQVSNFTLFRNKFGKHTVVFAISTFDGSYGNRYKHSHDDLGSYSIYINSSLFLCDPGLLSYTSKSSYMKSNQFHNGITLSQLCMLEKPSFFSSDLKWPQNAFQEIYEYSNSLHIVTRNFTGNMYKIVSFEFNSEKISVSEMIVALDAISECFLNHNMLSNVKQINDCSLLVENSLEPQNHFRITYSVPVTTKSMNGCFDYGLPTLITNIRSRPRSMVKELSSIKVQWSITHEK